MYKLTWYDYNCNAICDRLASFFVEDLDTFEEYLQTYRFMSDFPEMGHAEEILKKLARARAGEHFSDWYGGIEENPDLEFLQTDPSGKTLEEKTWSFGEREYELVNAFLWPSRVKARSATFVLKRVSFLGKEYLTASYRLEGVSGKAFYSVSESEAWERCRPYGNPVFCAAYVSPNHVKGDFSLYAGDVVRTVCDVIIRESDEQIPMPEELDDALLQRIMADIPGEGG